jgi:predicted phosphodiesterase
VRRALISDIHGNLEALEVVLDDIKAQGITEIFCLGDVIGYGPNPRECIDRVMETCKITLLGNHDQGAMFDPDGFNSGAERAIFWTREQLEAPADRDNNQRRWEFLGELPRSHRSGNCLFVHGSPRNPLSEYIFPEDIYNHRKMERLFQLVGRYCFQGHTHVPGSVGQPRDGDPRACYVVLEDGMPDDSTVNGDTDQPALVRSPKLVYRRLTYDFETTIQKIYSVPELEPFLGDRLRQGR